jgi:hypothetical protein
MKQKTVGQWNAYVEQGQTTVDRRRRLAEVPEDLRDSVAAHVMLVFRMRHAARLSKAFERSK